MDSCIKNSMPSITHKNKDALLKQVQEEKKSRVTYAINSQLLRKFKFLCLEEEITITDKINQLIKNCVDKKE